MRELLDQEGLYARFVTGRAQRGRSRQRRSKRTRQMLEEDKSKALGKAPSAVLGKRPR
jgi:hypothetical protein